MLEFLLEEKDFIEPTQVCVWIQPNSNFCGTNLSEIKLPEKCFMLGILREGKVILATENPVIYAGDRILAIAIHSMMAPCLKATLKRTHPVYYSLNTCSLDEQPLSIKKA
ncbi:potassium transporter TrkA [Scytonema sp. UIC 10036]|uniref:TrkA C-terminal domain-containing protein n=1 Tax=Scytonema sp. UIC 10036 TaxID=2304196 RepID=UPI0012DAB3BE|nr:TrkA C-terminal domain-containing protein [Scytonema sp. UIC 10036]MUG94488.1 potassium transporter TrkA [Scytonema sp. UIC 10036]